MIEPRSAISNDMAEVTTHGVFAPHTCHVNHIVFLLRSASCHLFDQSHVSQRFIIRIQLQARQPCAPKSNITHCNTMGQG